MTVYRTGYRVDLKKTRILLSDYVLLVPLRFLGTVTSWLASHRISGATPTTSVSKFILPLHCCLTLLAPNGLCLKT
jgi:hypothetical protein